jgi:hypothetical protein
MSKQQPPEDPPVTGPDRIVQELQPIVSVARRASRFSREFLVTVISVVTTAFGVVVALAWNTALSKWLETLQGRGETWGFFVYAGIVTFIGVIVIVVLGRLARRIGARPIEFKIEAPSEEQKG